MAKDDGNDVCMYEITFSFLHIEHTRYTDRNIYIYVKIKESAWL